MYLSYITLYKFMFTPALFISTALYLLRLKKRPKYWLRLAAMAAVMMLLAAVFPSMSSNALSNSVMFTCFFAATLLLTRFCYGVNWNTSFFCAVAGYSSQHIASICYSVLTALSGFQTTVQIYSTDIAQLNFTDFLIFLEVYALVYWILYFVFARQIHREENITVRNPMLFGIVVLLLLVEIVLNSFTLEYVSPSELGAYLPSSLTNLLCSVSILVILFGQLLQKSLEDELSIVQQMWVQERRQYEISSETIEMINIKCHDMKHQIRSLRNATTISPETLREIEDSIDIYGSFVKTGCKALDIILADKGLYGQRYHATINCIIDGEKLSFMSEPDIYSLFGNMLDNALESVIKLPEEMRTIDLSAKVRGSMLSISSHNYFEGSLRFESGMPKTTHEDYQRHGFGTRSMQLIVEKYGGTIHFSADENIFSVNILFPLSDASGGEAA